MNTFGSVKNCSTSKKKTANIWQGIKNTKERREKKIVKMKGGNFEFFFFECFSFFFLRTIDMFFETIFVSDSGRESLKS